MCPNVEIQWLQESSVESRGGEEGEESEKGEG